MSCSSYHRPLTNKQPKFYIFTITRYQYHATFTQPPYLFEVVDHIIKDGGPEVTELADIWHLTCIVVGLHVLPECPLAVMVLFTDTTHQHIRFLLMHLKYGD